MTVILPLVSAKPCKVSVAAKTIAVSKTNVSLAPIGIVENKRLDAVAAEPMAKENARSIVSVLQTTICLTIYVCDAGTVITAPVVKPNCEGPPKRSSALVAIYTPISIVMNAPSESVSTVPTTPVAILAIVIVPSDICVAVIAPVAILTAVTALSCRSAVVTESAAICVDVTDPVANCVEVIPPAAILFAVTAPSAIFAVVIAPEPMLAVPMLLSAKAVGLATSAQTVPLYDHVFPPEVNDAPDVGEFGKSIAIYLL